MTDFRILLAFAAFLVYALVFVERGFASAVAPFCSVCCAALFFALLGCFGLLPLAGWLYYLGALAAAGYLVFRFAGRKKMPRLSFGFWFFALGGLLVILSFWVRQPMFSTWDEFSFWGTAAKLTKLYGEFYTTAPSGWPWEATYPPFLVSLAYCAQFLGRGFVEWQVYAAYDLLLFSVIGALLAPYGRKHWNIAFPMAVIGFLAAFLFAQYTHLIMMSPVYIDSIADTPMGYLMGAALVLYFSAPKKDWRAMLPVCLALAALTLTKDMGLALALVAAALMLADMLLAKRALGERKSQHIIGALLRFGIFLACVAGPFVVWAVHLRLASGVDKTELGGTQNVGMLQMPVMFVKELFSAEKSAQFTEVMNGIPAALTQMRYTMIGVPVVVIAVFLLLLGLAALLTKDAAHRRRCVVFGVFSTLGYVPYFMLIMLTYIYIFRPDQVFASLGRYLYPYYIGWFFGVLVLLGTSAKNSRLVVEGKLVVLGLCAAVCVRFWQFVPLQYSMPGFYTEEFAERRAFAAHAAQIAQKLPEDSLTFIVSQNDNGIKWFTYCYELLPRQVDYSFGGGLMAPPGALPEDTPYLHAVTPGQWEQTLRERGVTHVFLDDVDEVFTAAYGPMFSDGLAAWQSGETNIYAVRDIAGGLRLEPV